VFSFQDIGDIYIWGWNERGQLGFPSKSIQIRSKHRQPSGNEPAVTAKSHTCKQSNDKEEDYINILTLPAVLDVEPWEVNILKVGCGSRHTAAITGTLYLFVQDAIYVYCYCSLNYYTDCIYRFKLTAFESVSKHQRKMYIIQSIAIV
jgi:hypothetical protein